MQSSTCSEYKQHNILQNFFLPARLMELYRLSPLYVASISDVELTRVSGFLIKLEDKPGVSIMADRGFTIKDILNNLGIDLNLSPFMQGTKQLMAFEVKKAEKLLIHASMFKEP